MNRNQTTIPHRDLMLLMVITAYSLRDNKQYELIELHQTEFCIHYPIFL